jgi:hypothetical protein
VVSRNFLVHSGNDSIDGSNQDEERKHKLGSKECITDTSREYNRRAYCNTIAQTIEKRLLPASCSPKIILENEGKESI